MPRLDLSADAKRDIQDILLHGLKEFGLAQAESYSAGLRDALDYVAQHPGAVRLRTEIRPAVRLYPHRAHHILYTVNGERVLILRILHHSANWIDHL